MISAFKPMPMLPVHLTQSDKNGLKMRAALGRKPSCLFTVEEILILSRLPERDYFQPEETKWMRRLLRTSKEREFQDVTQH